MHMLRVSARSATAAMALTLLSSLAPIQLPAQQEAGGQDVEPEAGVYTYAGGTVRGKRAKTQTTSFTFRREWNLAQSSWRKRCMVGAYWAPRTSSMSRFRQSAA